jgi:uncharacterized protein (TIGR01319 family)
MGRQEKRSKRRVLAGSVGECVHSLGVETFSEWMEDQDLGYVAVKLGPAVPIDDLVNKIRESRPEVVALSYRLGDLHLDKIVSEFIEKTHEYGIDPQSTSTRYCFGGLRIAANLVRAMTGKEVQPDKFSRTDDRHFDLEAVAEEYGKKPKYQGFFDLIVDDYITMEELEKFARSKRAKEEEKIKWSDDLLERIRQVREIENRPIIRAHIGIAAESIDPTVEDVKKISDAEALEIISLAPDQPSQTHLAKFVRGEEDPSKYYRGQGGAPIRTLDDLKTLKDATKRGNWPMTRIYSGTDELLELAKYFEEAFHMPFPAVPIFFYNQLDGRGPLPIKEGIDEHYEVMRWWASIDKPLEVNDPHQWQLRNCSDDMYVTDHVIAAVAALRMGIRVYVMQLMFDLPPQISPIYDLAKMRAAYELIEPLPRHFDFKIVRETRGGLSSFPPNLDMAKGHLAMTTFWQMYMEPDIVHVVSFPEAHHEARAGDIIESCDIIKQVFKHHQHSALPNIWGDPRVKIRIEELKKTVMYNILHLGLLAGYEGRVNLKNFKDYAVSPEEAGKREHPAGREVNYESFLLDIVDGKNYPGGECNMISSDNLDLALQTGLLQAPQLTVIDKRYEMVGNCRTKTTGGMCRIDEFDGHKVKDEMERVDRVRGKYPWFFYKEVSMANETSYITELEEKIEDDTVLSFRNQVGIKDVRNKNILAVDFGSTYTKVATFNTSRDDVTLKYVPTIVDDIRYSLADGLGVAEACRKAGNWDALHAEVEKYDVRLPCSSAKGGLKMVTVSLTKDESGFAAELASLTAGAKLLASYEGKLAPEQAKTVYTVDQPEIILLTGGVNEGGDVDTQLHNARMLAEASSLATYARYGVPVIYSGNQDIREEVQRIFQSHGVDIRTTDNIMPEVNQYSIETINEVIRDLFQTIIIRGKGFDVVEEFMSAKFLPTPRAAFLGINLLAKGYGEQAGLGNIVGLDIGGCTTDFFANVRQNPLYAYPWEDARKRVKRTILKTPNAPLAYRRVEGKYGLSYNAENLMDLEKFKNGRMKEELDDFFNCQFADFLPQDDPLSQFCGRNNGRWEIALGPYVQWIHAHPHHLPETRVENGVRSFLAKEIMAVATGRNVGYVTETDTYFLQYGVNFYTTECTLVLIGGPIYHKCRQGLDYNWEDLRLIARGALFNEKEYTILRPHGKVLLDGSYLISTVGGLYGRLDPEGATRILKKNLIPLEL